MRLVQMNNIWLPFKNLFFPSLEEESRLRETEETQKIKKLLEVEYEIAF